MLQEPDSLWLKVLGSKYIHGEVSKKKALSNAWQGISKAAPILNKGVKASPTVRKILSI